MKVSGTSISGSQGYNEAHIQEIHSVAPNFNALIINTSVGKSTAYAVVEALPMSSQPSNEIFLVNPYQSHTSLTPVEAEVLWEYAKLAQNLRVVCLNISQD